MGLGSGVFNSEREPCVICGHPNRVPYMWMRELGHIAGWCCRCCVLKMWKETATNVQDVIDRPTTECKEETTCVE